MKESDRLAAMGETLARAGAKIELFEDGCAIEGPTPLRGVDGRRPASTTASPCRWRSRSSSRAATRSCSTTWAASRRASRPSSALLDELSRGAAAVVITRRHRALRRPRPPGRPQPLARDAERRVRAGSASTRSTSRCRSRRSGSTRRSRGAHALGFQGLNVTVPHKQRAAGALRRRSTRSRRRSGAVNTLRRAAGAAGRASTPTRPPASRSSRRPGSARARGRSSSAPAAPRARPRWALLRAGATLRVAARRAEAARELGRSPLAAPSAGRAADRGRAVGRARRRGGGARTSW